MRKEVELRRHTDADGDILTAEGVAAALEIGERLRGPYHLAVSTGAQRATQTLACFLARLGQKVPGGVIVEPGLRSEVEDGWRAGDRQGGGGGTAARGGERAARLGAAGARTPEGLPGGGRPPVVGHTPTKKPATLGLTGQIAPP